MLIIEDLTFRAPVAVCDTLEQAEELMKEYTAEIFRRYESYGAEISAERLNKSEFKDIFEYGMVGFEVYEIGYNSIMRDTPISPFFGHCKENGELFNVWTKEAD